MKKALLIFGLVLFLAPLTALLVVAPRNPIAEIVVVDSMTNPVVGAVITPDGYRPKGDGGHHGWDTNLAPATPRATDRQGRVLIEYPRFAEERLEVGELSFGVAHPDYCPERPFRTVDHTPPPSARFWARLWHRALVTVGRAPRRAEPVVLRKGAALRVAGYLSGSTNFVANLHVQVLGVWAASSNFWMTETGGWQFSRRLESGPNQIRAVAFVGEHSYFSEVANINLSTSQTNELRLELRRGLQVSGALDSSVPRPLQNGFVIAEVWSPSDVTGRKALVWHTWAAVHTNGHFAFEDLPPGRLELFSVCDGFVSKERLAANAVHRNPQSWILTNETERIDVAMVPAGTLEVKVLDENGEPLEGAVLVAWPNCIWGNWGSTIFPGTRYRTSTLIKSNTPIDRSTVMVRSFSATSDSSGIVVLGELPAGRHSYAVEHANYVVPVQSNRRDRDAVINAGETTRVTLPMIRRGRDTVAN